MDAISQSLLSFLASALIVVFLGPVVIPVLRRLKFGQVVRGDGPSTHLKKSGTPTMGGIMMIVALTLVGLARSRPYILHEGKISDAGIALLAAIGVTLVHGLLGFADDYIKVALKRPLGLRARHKLAGQLLSALVLAYVTVNVLDLGTCVTMPFVGIAVDLGGLYYAFIVFIVLGTTNAMNLTDGADGLAAGASVATFVAMTLVSLAVDSPTMAIFSAACGGAALGFLWHNHHPAKVWMGDTGSLALGAALVSISVLTKTELLLPVIGGLYVIEALSVIIQVVSFKLTGRRVFKMAPLHHHYELLGYKETSVVFGFWLVSLTFGVLGLLGLRGLGR